MVITKGLDLTAPGGPVDVFWTAQNYHDLYNPIGKGQPTPATLMGINKAVFAALKPGGIYFIIDHVAPAGAGTTDTSTLHRIDPAVVRKDVEAAGFVYVGASDVLRNPADPHDKAVFDASIRGHTDQFVLKFRKPHKSRGLPQVVWACQGRQASRLGSLTQALGFITPTAARRISLADARRFDQEAVHEANYRAFGS